MSNILLDIGLIMIFATVAGIIARFFKQPLIPAYIISGIILGPILGLITDQHTITLLAEIGIAFLLFIVGMELDLRRLKEIGAVASLGGTLQIVILFVLGLLTGIFLRYEILPAIYIGIIMAFSSTMVVIKLLGDRNELDTLHGRIIIGFLLMQDIFAIIALSVLSRIGEGVGGTPLVISLVIVGALLMLAYFLSRFIFPGLFAWAAKTPELLFILAVSVCLAFSLLFTYAGFSLVVGAFVAGIVLGNLHYNTEIVSRIKPLKDFFGVIFFGAIGLKLQVVNFHSAITPFIILLLFTIIILPVITITICALFGYKRRTAFLTGIS
ncbi:cation:proton antiporter, partial [Candidatus Woesearchaeota archaeon]|nr:cation:proton antiporter [Candidatus Woesearchaeota archaeon]